MTDRELLEAAAKAAGLSIYFDDIGQCCKRIPGDIATTWLWEPLEDDGDALRLAVKLRLRVCTPTTDDDLAIASSGDVRSTGHVNAYSDEKIKNIYAATRSAIVRAAAEMGSKS